MFNMGEPKGQTSTIGGCAVEKQHAPVWQKPSEGVPAYAQRDPWIWNLAVLHIAFLAIRVASIGYDPLRLPLPVKMASAGRAATFAPQAGTVNQFIRPVRS